MPPVLDVEEDVVEHQVAQNDANEYLHWLNGGATVVDAIPFEVSPF